MKMMVLAVALSLAGCAATLEKPQNLKEQLLYTDAALVAVVKTLGELTCLKYQKSGECVEAGKPLHPAVTKLYLDRADMARSAARAAGTMPANGGMCLGQPSTPQACFALASTALVELRGVLTSLKRN